jgi:hypothetical protein
MSGVIMNDQIHVVLDSIPSDAMSLVVSIMSGIVVPVMLLVIALYVTRKAEKRAISHADELRWSDRKQLFSDNTHTAIDNLYKSIQALRHNNLKRKKHEEWSKQVFLNNEIIMSSNSTDAKLMQQDLLRWHLENNLELESQHGSILIDVASAQTKLQHLLTEQSTSNLDLITNEILGVAKDADMISEAIVAKFVNEINILMTEVESHPEKWIKP